MSKIRRWWPLAVVGVVAAVAIGAATGVMAQTPVPGISGDGTFIDRVAQKLGISSDTLSEAIKSSANDAIDERVASGDLTQEQADAMKERIANAPDQALGGLGRGPGFGGRHGGPGFFGGDELAAFLGITADELRTEMHADGATLASVAEAHGKSRDELKAFLTDQIKAHLDEEVANGDHTQEEADQKLADFTANLDAMIDGTMPQGGPGMHGGLRPGMGGSPGSFGDFDGAPSGSSTPQSGASSSSADQG